MAKVREDESASGGGFLVPALVGVVALAVGGAAGFVVGDRKGKQHNRESTAEAIQEAESARAKETEALVAVSEMEKLVKSKEEKVAIAVGRVKELEAWQAILKNPEPVSDDGQKFAVVKIGDDHSFDCGDARLTLIGARNHEDKGVKLSSITLLIEAVRGGEPFTVNGWDTKYVTTDEKTGDKIVTDRTKMLRLQWVRIFTDDGEQLVPVERKIESDRPYRDFTIRKNETVQLVYTFERPKDGAKAVKFSLPPDYNNLGRCRFQIPASEFKPSRS